MIKNIKHKGLERFYSTGSRKGLAPRHAERLRDVLGALDGARAIRDMGAPGFKLHQLAGNRKGVWAVSVSGARS